MTKTLNNIREEMCSILENTILQLDNDKITELWGCDDDYDIITLADRIANREINLDKIYFIEVKRIANVIYEIDDLITVLENKEKQNE